MIRKSKTGWITRCGRGFFFMTLLVGGACLGVDAPLRAQTPVWERSIDSLVITAVPLVDVGMQVTRIDSTALATVISSSLADVLSQRTSLFIKSYGRSTLSTASIRGTAPSHTQVTWNGMKINSPMLGMVDFSMIPSYFVDEATLYAGASAVNVTSGSLGGAVALASRSVPQQGFHVTFAQGLSSFWTVDDFLRVRYGKGRWQGVTRVAYAHSRNDFPYTNYRKKIFETDAQGVVVGEAYPRERNKHGQYDDAHVQQECYYTAPSGFYASLAAWYTHSVRGVPMLNVDYKDQDSFTNLQQEQTLRAVVSAHLPVGRWTWRARAGYTYTDLLYRYEADPGNGVFMEMIHSQSYVNTLFGQLHAERTFGSRLFWDADASINQHFVKSSDHSVMLVDGQKAVVGYDKARAEYALLSTLRYRPVPQVGLSLSLREDCYGTAFTPLIPAFYADWRLSERGNLMVKTSVSRNFRAPTLNDLYFMPGGNDTLQSERGFSFDGGFSFDIKQPSYGVSGQVTGYYSRIRNWIVWLPTFKGFWSPVNVKEVLGYGVEAKAKAFVDWGRIGATDFDGHFSWTRSINQGDPAHWADASIGQQLVYIPEFSAAFTLSHVLRTWTVRYAWTYYSQRYTTSAAQTATLRGVMPPYFMNGVTVEKRFAFKRVSLTCKALVNNLFNEEYESVLSRPMPGRNYGLFVELQF